jgi:hypothetical protein
MGNWPHQIWWSPSVFWAHICGCLVNHPETKVFYRTFTHTWDHTMGCWIYNESFLIYVIMFNIYIYLTIQYIICVICKAWINCEPFSVLFPRSRWWLESSGSGVAGDVHDMFMTFKKIKQFKSAMKYMNIGRCSQSISTNDWKKLAMIRIEVMRGQNKSMSRVWSSLSYWQLPCVIFLQGKFCKPWVLIMQVGSPLT